MNKILTFTFAAIWFLFDLITKKWALNNLMDSYHEVTSFLNWRLVFNHGAAFSFLADHSGWQKWFFIVIALFISRYIAYLIFVERLRYWTIFAYAGILGGALGNVYDRFQFGYVIDFIDVHFSNWHYPTFNIADIGICLGVITLLIASFFEKKE